MPFLQEQKTVAHKLARACFYVLRDQVEFDVNKAFACMDAGKGRELGAVSFGYSK